MSFMGYLSEPAQMKSICLINKAAISNDISKNSLPNKRKKTKLFIINLSYLAAVFFFCTKILELIENVNFC